MLRSTGQLGPALILTLFRMAAELHQSGDEQKGILSEEASGTVKSMRRDVHLGVFGGPAFEASLDTPGGQCLVSYMLTQEGLHLAREMEEAQREAQAREQMRWN